MSLTRKPGNVIRRRWIGVSVMAVNWFTFIQDTTSKRWFNKLNRNIAGETKKIYFSEDLVSLSGGVVQLVLCNA